MGNQEKTFSQIFGEKLNTALAERNVSQIELARALGYQDKAANTISYYCAGKRTPNLEQFDKIVGRLDVSADFLLGRTGDVMTRDQNTQIACDVTGLNEESVERLHEITFNDGFDNTENLKKIVPGLIASEHFPALITSIAIVVNSIKNLKKPIKEKTRVDVLKELQGRIRAAKHAIYDSVDSFRDVLNDIVLSEIGYETTADTAVSETETKFRELKAVLWDGEREAF